MYTYLEHTLRIHIQSYILISKVISSYRSLKCLRLNYKKYVCNRVSIYMDIYNSPIVL